MSDHQKLLNDIKQARVESAEQRVVERLRAKGLLPDESTTSELFCHSCNRAANTACVEQGHETLPSTGERPDGWTLNHSMTLSDYRLATAADRSEKKFSKRRLCGPPAPRAGEAQYFTDNEILVHVIKSRDCQHGVGFTYDFCPIVNYVNQHATLVEQRGQLIDALQEMLNRFYPHTCDRGPMCAKCGVLKASSGLLATIEQEGEASR